MDTHNYLIISGIFAVMVLGLFFPSSFAVISEGKFEILQTGIFSTNLKDFTISNDFVIKTIIEDKLFKISGTTIDGYPYFAYHRLGDDQMVVLGKVIIDKKFIPIISKPEISEDETISPVSQKDFLILVKQPALTIPQQNYFIQIKVFDTNINSSPRMSQNFGSVSDVDLAVTFTHESGILYKSLNGKTNSDGVFYGSFYVNDNETKPGKYNVKITATDGINTGYEETFTFIESSFSSDGKSS